MAKIKISELPTLAQQLQAANFVPVIHSGDTYKISLFNYLVKNSGDETIAGVKTFSSSPIVPAGDATGEAVNYDQLTLVDQKHSVIDNTSRVAEYTGDGIPLIPDNVAGTTYRSNFATTDGWSGTGATIAVSGGVLTATSAGLSYCGAYRPASYGTGKHIVVRVKSSVSGTVSIRGVVGGVSNTFIKSISVVAGVWTDSSAYVSADLTSISVAKESGVTTGDTVSIQDIYIGTGAYDYQNKDRAGNGNSLTLNAVTPVNGKYCKEMSFNGSSSYAQAASPVIGTTGTVAVRFKRGDVGRFQYVFANLDGSGNKGVAINFNASNMMRLIFGFSASIQIVELSAIAETTAYHTLVFTFSGSAYTSILDLVEKNGAITGTIDTPIANLILGGIVTSPQGNCIISHFRYDSRIWTADEARAWSLNPISIDSRV